jgi:myo-inositol 2-dehydrogenase / D-chiro-inositol 1-dehydrogenase
MNLNENQNPQSNSSRRNFLQTSAFGIAAGAVAGTFNIARAAHAGASETLKVGLIGCGGRGNGAAVQALEADPNVKLTALGDAFADSLEAGLKAITKGAGENAKRIDVPQERRFVGFNAYQQVIDSGVDVVLLAAPPHFRPQHLEAAVKANKHIFAEKPVAVDAPGVRSVLKSAAEAKAKNLSLVSGLCYRYHATVQETMNRIHDQKQIGEIITVQANSNRGSAKMPLAREPGWSKMEHQLRNWYFHTWLSGDFNVEQAIHQLDIGAWALLDKAPLRATGTGGRQVRVDPKYVNIYYHFAVCY